MSPSNNENLMRWLAGGKRGISSNTIVQHLTGLPALADWSGDHPHDPADLARCRRLLEEVPELKPDFVHRMASFSGPWAKLVANWDALCALMDIEAPKWRDGEGTSPATYKLMKELIDAGRLADGWTQPFPGHWKGPDKQRQTTVGNMTISTQ